MEIFMKASKNKWRFQSPKGIVSSEELWSYGEEILSAMYAELNNSLSSSTGLLSKPTNKDSEIKGKMEIIKAIFEHKQQQAADAMLAKIEKDKKELINSLIVEKEVEGLKNLPIEELKKLL